MKWEDLKVYRPLTKEELKPAYKDFTQIVAANLKPFGFHLLVSYHPSRYSWQLDGAISVL